MLRQVDWLKVLRSYHVWALIVSGCSSLAFINYQIQTQDHKFLKSFTFNFLSLMTSYCIIQTIRMDPGRVPLIWDFEKSTTKKYCLLCHNFKPDRTHHCSTCGICVLDMDHHCPWLGNCIGFYNRKTFMLSVIYGWLNLLLGISFCIFKALDYRNLQPIDLMYFLFPLALICGMFVLMTIFLKFHLFLMFDNMTTIEHLEKKRALFPDSQPYKYDLGCLRNTQQVFGSNTFTWCLPIQSDQLINNGVTWKLNRNTITTEISLNQTQNDIKQSVRQFGRMTIGNDNYSQQFSGVRSSIIAKDQQRDLQNKSQDKPQRFR